MTLLEADKHTHFFLVMDFQIRKIRNRKLQKAAVPCVPVVPETSTNLSVSLLRQERLNAIAQKRLINIIKE